MSATDHFHPPLPQPESPGTGSGKMAVPGGHEPRVLEARAPSQSARQLICWSQRSAGLRVALVRQWPWSEPTVIHWHSWPAASCLAAHRAADAGPLHASGGAWHAALPPGPLPLPGPQRHLLSKDALVAPQRAAVATAAQGSAGGMPPTGASVAPQVWYASHR